MSHKIGITGGIGSGKSVVSRILRNLGIPVYDSDQEAKRLIHSHPDIRKELTALVGDALYATDGILRKDLLASYLFASPEHAESVNSIVHPRVRSDFREWLAAHATAPYIAIESAILYESHLDQDVDQVWLVDAPRELRIRRATLRDRSTREQILSRMARQSSDEELRKKADKIICNDESHPLLPQILPSIQKK